MGVCQGPNTCNDFRTFTHKSFREPSECWLDVVSFSCANWRLRCSSASDTLACLRKASSTDLQAVNVAVANTSFYGMDNFVPVVDGTFITQRPTLALKSGKLNTVCVYDSIQYPSKLIYF